MASHSALVLALFLVLLANQCVDGKKPHFVLVHGAGHGAWCWYKVTRLLQRIGHTVDVLDLRSAGINSQDPATLHTLDEYSRPLIDLLESMPKHEKVVLVGHSYGGASVTYAMENYSRKVRAGVFLAAFMLPSGRGQDIVNQILEADQAVLQYHYVNGTRATFSFNLELVTQAAYQMSPPEDAVLARSLLKPAPLLNLLVNTTSRRYGSIPRFYVRTSQDKLLFPKFQDLMIRAEPPSAVIGIKSDHSPFFSKPHLLASILNKIALSS